MTNNYVKTQGALDASLFFPFDSLDHDATQRALADARRAGGGRPISLWRAVRPMPDGVRVIGRIVEFSVY